MKTNKEYYTNIGGELTRHASKADAFEHAFNALRDGHEFATVYADDVEVFESTRNNREVARKSIGAHALEILSAIVNK